jgi:hypothetical protein
MHGDDSPGGDYIGEVQPPGEMQLEPAESQDIMRVGPNGMIEPLTRDPERIETAMSHAAENNRMYMLDWLLNLQPPTEYVFSVSSEAVKHMLLRRYPELAAECVDRVVSDVRPDVMRVLVDYPGPWMMEALEAVRSETARLANEPVAAWRRRGLNKMELMLKTAID